MYMPPCCGSSKLGEHEATCTARRRREAGCLPHVDALTRSAGGAGRLLPAHQPVATAAASLTLVATRSKSCAYMCFPTTTPDHPYVGCRMQRRAGAAVDQLNCHLVAACTLALPSGASNGRCLRRAVVACSRYGAWMIRRVVGCGSSIDFPRYPTFFCKLTLFRFFSHNYAPGSFISKNGPYARRHHHWRRASVCRRQYYWRAYVRRWCDLGSTWHVPRRHRSWRPVNDD
jgi:hypothetical protein